MLISIICKDIKSGHPIEKESKYMNKPFIIETKTASKDMKKYLTTLEIRLIECSNNDPIFLAKDKNNTKQKNTQ